MKPSLREQETIWTNEKEIVIKPRMVFPQDHLGTLVGPCRSYAYE